MRLRSPGEVGIAADDQPLAGEVGRGDRRHVALVEQRQLQGPAVHQRLDGRGAQRADPVQPGRLEVLVDPGLGDQAAVADQHHVGEVEALLELVDLRAEGLRVGDVAREHLDRHRATIGGAEQAIDDLQLALLAVPVVAEARERAAAAFDIARRDVVEHQRAAPQVAPGQRGLDRRLAGQQPVERGIQLLLVDWPQAEHRAQAGGGGGRIERLGGRQLRGRGEDPADDQRHDQIAAAVALGAEQAVETDLAQRAEHGGDMAVRQRAGDGQGLLRRPG